MSADFGPERAYRTEIGRLRSSIAKDAALVAEIASRVADGAAKESSVLLTADARRILLEGQHVAIAAARLAALDEVSYLLPDGQN